MLPRTCLRNKGSRLNALHSAWRFKTSGTSIQQIGFTPYLQRTPPMNYNLVEIFQLWVELEGIFQVATKSQHSPSKLSAGYQAEACKV